MDKIADADEPIRKLRELLAYAALTDELAHEFRELLAYVQTEKPSRARIADELHSLSGRLKHAGFQDAKFDSVLNGLHAILDLISDGR